MSNKTIIKRAAVGSEADVFSVTRDMEGLLVLLIEKDDRELLTYLNRDEFEDFVTEARVLMGWIRERDKGLNHVSGPETIEGQHLLIKEAKYIGNPKLWDAPFLNLASHPWLKQRRYAEIQIEDAQRKEWKVKDVTTGQVQIYSSVTDLVQEWRVD